MRVCVFVLLLETKFSKKARHPLSVTLRNSDAHVLRVRLLLCHQTSTCWQHCPGVRWWWTGGSAAAALRARRSWRCRCGRAPGLRDGSSSSSGSLPEQRLC